ncbi:hypothetical protein BUL45_10230 [Clostridium perfringens]|nr:hypothetical protein [Clostridium perfringens]
MINKKKLSALLLSGTMFMSMNTNVFASNLPSGGVEGTEQNPAKATITKNFEFSEGINTPNATFKFTAEKITNDAPDATIGDINYTQGDNGTLSNGKYSVKKTTEITFGNFPHAGEYDYNVKETNEGVGGITYDTKEYKVHVYVANSNAMDGKTYVKAITSENGGEKAPIEFVNTYKKDTSLLIEKNVTGDLADLTKQFEFQINLKKSATSDITKFEGNIIRKDGKIEPVTYTAENTETFKLANGDKLKFESIPAGTKYEVKEIGASDGYTPSITVIENGNETSNNRTVAEKDGISSKSNSNDNLIGEGENKVTFTNTYNDKPITGIVMNNIPFILMISFAVLGFGALAIIKRRKTIR